MKSNPITTRTARIPLVMSLPAARCLLAALCALLAAFTNDRHFMTAGFEILC